MESGKGVLYHVDGSPTFESGKEIVLLLNKTSHGFVPTNLTLGKYEIIRSAGVQYLKSSVFPNHPRLGKIKFKDAMSSFEKYFGSSLQVVNHDKFVYKGNIKKKKVQDIEGGIQRSPASDEISEESGSDLSIFAIIIIFALLGFLSAYSVRSEKKQ